MSPGGWRLEPLLRLRLAEADRTAAAVAAAQAGLAAARAAMEAALDRWGEVAQAADAAAPAAWAGEGPGPGTAGAGLAARAAWAARLAEGAARRLAEVDLAAGELGAAAAKLDEAGALHARAAREREGLERLRERWRADRARRRRLAEEAEADDRPHGAGWRGAAGEGEPG